MQTMRFILALGIGWFLVDRDLSLPWIALWIVAASSALTLLALVLQLDASSGCAEPSRADPVPGAVQPALLGYRRNDGGHRGRRGSHPAATRLKVTPYIKPGFFTTRVFNPLVGFLAGRLGLSMKGARVLSVQGRKSGEWHSTPVNPLTFRGQRYLVAPRGETQWVRNIRVSRAARLTVGGKTEDVRVEEVPDHEKPPILRAYLQEWAWEVKQFFGGVGAGASEAEIARIASNHPVFRIR